jgi:hypothetical protein
MSGISPYGFCYCKGNSAQVFHLMGIVDHEKDEEEEGDG